MSLQRTDEATTEDDPDQECDPEHEQAAGEKAPAQLVNELLRRFPVRQEDETADTRGVGIARQREHAADVAMVSKAAQIGQHAKGPGGGAGDERRRVGHPRRIKTGCRGVIAGQQDHLAPREPGDFTGQAVGQTVPDRQRSQDLVGETRRHRDQQEQLVALTRQGAGGRAGLRLLNRAGQFGRWRCTGAGPSRTRQPAAVGVGHDGEVRRQLTAVAIDHRVNGGVVARETGVGEVRPEDRQLGDQQRLRHRRGRAAFEQAVEGPARRIDFGAGAAARLARHHLRREDEHRGERRPYQQGHRKRDLRRQLLMPGQRRIRRRGCHRHAQRPARRASVSPTSKAVRRLCVIWPVW